MKLFDKQLFWISLITLLLLAACSGKRGQLKPLNQDATIEEIVAGLPQLVTFEELQADPEAYQDKLIRVTGAYFSMPPPKCFPHSGPDIRWALISQGLRLDAVGFARLTRLLSDNQLMTVDGFFRLYEGPLGCGKGAPSNTAWFLEVTQIVQPNPLARAVNLGGDGGIPVLGLPGTTPTFPGTAMATQPPIVVTDQPGIPTATLIGTIPAPATGTVTTPPPVSSPTNIPTATLTPQATTGATATVTVSPTPTLQPSVPTSTPTSGPVLTSPPLPTSTSGYPGPATSTPGAYPPLGTTPESTSYP